MFLFVAKLTTIPEELTEAAAVDGASTLETIRHVTLPLLRSTIGMVVLLAAIHSLRLFEIVYVMTSGGPVHHSEVLSSWAYFQAFTANKVGYGSAVLVALLAITFVLSYVHVTRFQPKEQY
jgi:raffinose/stachyose/melibiose transport system permease protein